MHIVLSHDMGCDSTRLGHILLDVSNGQQRGMFARYPKHTPASGIIRIARAAVHARIHSAAQVFCTAQVTIPIYVCLHAWRVGCAGAMGWPAGLAAPATAGEVGWHYRYFSCAPGCGACQGDGPLSPTAFSPSGCGIARGICGMLRQRLSAMF